MVLNLKFKICLAPPATFQSFRGGGAHRKGKTREQILGHVSMGCVGFGTNCLKDHSNVIFFILNLDSKFAQKVCCKKATHLAYM